MKNRQKVFTHIVCNLAICFVLLLVLFFSGFSAKQSNFVSAGNSEYNGTIYAGDKAKNNVTLMINVYWGTEHLVKMLDILKEKNVKTTFFIGGTWARENVETLKRIKEEGHEIASHGYSHKEHGKLSLTENLAEIQKCHEIVKELIGEEMELFAPPGGSYNKNTVSAANTLGYKTIMWSKDTIDWRDQNENLIFNRATTNLVAGDLVLMHPTKCTAKVLSRVLDEIKSRGLNQVTVSETLGFSKQDKPS